MHLRTTMVPWVLALLLVITGCNGSSDSSEPSGPLAVSVQTLDANGTPSDDFASGEQITFSMTAQNTSSQPQTFNIQGCFGPAAYAVFERGDATEVEGGYMRQGPECESEIRGGEPVTLAPGESTKASITWAQGTTGGKVMPPGAYSVIAGVACVQSDACMPLSTSGPLTLSKVGPTIYRSPAVGFTINP